MNKAWITVEDNTLMTGFSSVAQEVLDHFNTECLEIADSNSSYFVLHLLYEDLEEVKDVASITTYLLMNAYVTQFTMTINTSDLI